MNYRELTDDEIVQLEDNGCWAEDWSNVTVADDFMPIWVRRVKFYGEVQLGVFELNVEVSKGFMQHSGIEDAVLRNVTIGNNCLITHVGNFINNYEIGDDCLISNICTMETT